MNKKFLLKGIGLSLMLSTACLLAACVGNPEDVSNFDPDQFSFPHKSSEYLPSTEGLLEENILDDKYDNYYQIYVYSFCDSDGNGRGDLNGITSKLDYLRAMGYTGIWLTPITEGGSEHKYDVKNYMAIDSTFGTLDDFKTLVTEAHKRGIKVILDMVFNHTSRTHPWFAEAAHAFLDNDTSNYYYGFYNLSKTARGGYQQTNLGGTQLWVESSQGQASLPDLNLDNGNVRTELAKVIEFWIKDYKVDGFRLDAVKDYYSSTTNSARFVSWIAEQARKYNPNAYIVGEVYSDANQISSFYRESDADSYFWFPEGYFPSWSWPNHEGTIGYYVKRAVNVGDASSAVYSYMNAMNNMITGSPNGIPAPFLDSHDTDRIADGCFGGNETMIKFAYGLFSMYTGNTFTYYGDEIGMMGIRRQNEQIDSNRRLGMLWCNDDTSEHPYIVPAAASPNYKFDGVMEQIKDEYSILNYYKVCNNVRNAFPAIMRGTPTRVSYSDDTVLVVRKTMSGQTPVLIIINFSNTNKTVNLTGELAGTLRQGICVSGSVSTSGSAITMPGFSIAIVT